MSENVQDTSMPIVFSGPRDQLADEAELLFTRNLRVELVKQYTRDGRIPQDPEQAEVLLRALKDMDASTFTRMKIKSDDKNTAVMANSAALIAEALKQVNGNTGKITILENAAVTNVVAELPSHLKRDGFISGELDQGTVNTTYDEFIKKASDVTVQ